MRQLRKTALSRETLLVLNAFIFLVLIILNITACGNNDEGKTQNEHHYSRHKNKSTRINRVVALHNHGAIKQLLILTVAVKKML